MSNSYQSDAAFWNTESATVVGHMISRPPAVAMLGDISDRLVWEAGAGSGFVARMLARKKAKVIGTDLNPEMLAIAEEKERADRLGIEYRLGDIRSSGFPAKHFDAVITAGVLIHFSAAEIGEFYSEASRVMKKGATLVAAFTHPWMYSSKSPARIQAHSREHEPCWIKFTPRSEKKNDFDQLFVEQYYDLNGRCFTSDVWYHQLNVYVDTAAQAGLRLEKVDQIIFPKALCSPIFGNKHGYQAYMHLKFIK